ncbi:MAG: SLBB domain-containing protein [Dehalococcoidia bacterium]|nr:SLBB domain-containing protein [Dehalococcoidia bacterium]
MKKLYITTLVFLFLGTLFAQTTNSQNTRTDLLSFSSISITIGGQFPVNGTFPALITERVDQYITRMYNQASERLLRNTDNPALLDRLKRDLNDFSLRGIVLKRSTGEELILDLLKFRITGDFKDNPYLKNDDVLIFPALDIELNFVRILGAVNNPTTFMYVDGDMLSDAITLAQGINEAYEEVKDVVIYRLNYQGTKTDSVVCQIDDQILLKRGDRVRVIADETRRRDYIVNVIGEVFSPGFIPITHNNTTIKEIIENVGGFKPGADLNRAEIIRGASAFEKLVFSEESEKLQMFRMSTLIEDDSLYFQVDEKLRFLRGSGIIDFTKIFDPNFSDGNFIVQNYDVIYIPSKLDLVYVYGQVNKAGYVKYIPSEKYSYYLQAAGGMGDTGSDVYIIKGKSRSWITVKDNLDVVIEPGDYIWVSKKTPRTFWYHVDQAAKVTSIIGTIATIALLIVQLSK